MFESTDEVNSDMTLLYPQNGKHRRLSKGSFPNGAYGNSNSKDSQQLATIKPPHGSASSSSVQNQLLFLKLLQGSGGQQVLTQQLGQLQMHKQQLLQQLNQLSKSAGQGGSGMNTTFQQQNQAITHKLTTITQMINQVNQQLMILSQLSSQQKDVSKNAETGCTNIPSPKLSHNPPPMRLKSDPKGTGSLGRSQSANALMGLGMGSIEQSRSLAYGIQSLSLSSPVQSSVSQSSARSMSRLQQIISGSSSSDSLVNTSSREDRAFQPSVQAFNPTTPGPHRGSFAPPGSHQPSNTTSPFSPPQSGSLGLVSDSSFFSGGVTSGASFTNKKSVSDIQEFRPGVPWQPKSQATEPSQLYCKQTSVPTGSNFHDGNMFGQPSGPKQQSFGSNIQLTRSQSTNGSYYNSAIGSQSKYPNSGWSSKPAKEAQGMGQLNLRMSGSHKTYVHGPYQPKPPTPSSEMMTFTGWKSKGRTVIPPSSLYPSQDFQYKPGFGARKHYRMAGTPQPQYSPSQGSWGSSFTADTPSSSMISNTVWGPDPVSIPEDIQQYQGWGLGYTRGGHSWMDTRSNQPQNDPPSSFTSPPSQSDTSPSECYTPTSVDSLTSGGSTWGQDELHSLSSKQGMVSPEPTFAEWQAGKKARLSLTKFPSNPPSPWLIVRNIKSQVSF